MKILLVGGFFGSGKTTLIARLIPVLQARGQLVCIVENEIGQNSVDDLLLKNAQVQVTTIAGGCVCCQVTGSLVEAAKKLQQEYAPNWLIVELSGTAYLLHLKERIQEYLKDCAITTITVLDAARWDKLIRAAAIVMGNQLEGGETVVINKLDVLDEYERISREAAQYARTNTILPFSAVRETGEKLADAIERAIASEDAPHEF